jgi:hypothetical protein
VERKGRGDRPVRIEPVGLDGVMRTLLDEGRDVRDHVLVAHEARDVDRCDDLERRQFRAAAEKKYGGEDHNSCFQCEISLIMCRTSLHRSSSSGRALFTDA